MRTKLPKAPVTETVTTKIFKAAAKLMLPKKIQAIGREEWILHMVTIFSAMKLTTEQWGIFYDAQTSFYQKALGKGYPVRFAGIGNVLPQRVEPKNLVIEKETTVNLGKGIYPTFLTNEQLVNALN
jgi:hypothetical protein